MKLPLYPLAIVAALVLTGCGAGGTSTSAAPQANNDAGSNSPLNFGMPRSLQQSDDSDSSDDNDNASDESNNDTETAADVTRETNTEMAQVIMEQDSHEVPMSALFIEADMLHERLEFTQYQLEDLDDVWEQIVSNCSAIADGETCSIPAGTLTTDNSSEDEDDAQFWDSSVYLTGRDIDYVRKPDATYEHAISFSETYEDTDKVTEEYRWNEDQSRILSKMDGQWQFDGMSGTFASNFVYAKTDKGSEITFMEESKDTESEHKLSMQLRELGGEKNDIEAQTQSSWTYGDETGTTTSDVVANDDGGRLGSTSEFTLADGTNEKIHSRHTFNDEGDVTSAEYCEEAQGIDCSKAENWEKVDESELSHQAQYAGTDVYEGDAELMEGFEGDIEQLGFYEGDVDEMEFTEEMFSSEGPLDYFELTDEEFEAMSGEFFAAEEGFDVELGAPELGAANFDSEFDWENADIAEELFFVLGEDDMDSDFFDACQEMGMDESDCEFGEVLTLEGTEHSIENVKDALESVCEDMGISKEDCPIER